MPIQPTLNPSGFQSGQVGSLYHVGLSDGVNSYGYVLQNWGSGDQRSALSESSNVTDKAALTQYSSQALIDRDLAYYPRVSQGDFSSGLLQEVFIDNTREFDSDLEIRTPGYLMLRPAWQRKLLVTGASATNMQSAPWNTDVWTVFGGPNIFRSDALIFSPASGINNRFIDSDGNVLFVGDAVNTIKFTLGGAWTTLLSTIGAFQQMWAIYQGTNGRFVYVTGTSGNTINNAADNLFRIDVNNPALVQVVTNSTHFNIVDIVGYQNGIAILSNDPGGTGFDVWYHDGVNMTRIVRVNQYLAVGIAPCLGDLYVTATSTAQFEAPILTRISAGSFEIVVRTGSPLTTFTNAAIGAPQSSGQYVCFALQNPQINNVTTSSYIGVYDVISGSYSHLGSLDGTDTPAVAGPRQLTFSGRAVAFPMAVGGNGSLQFQTNTSRLPALVSPVPLYAASGWMVSSKIDFNTPGIAKRFRRVEVHHSPLAAGEQLVVKAFLDSDPLSFSPSLTPVPSTATTTNSTVGSSVTTLTIGSNQSVGRSLYYAIQLTAGTNQQTTPKVIYTAIEVGGTWIWDLHLDCTNQRRLLNQATIDPQGVTGKDLAYLIRNAYENGGNLTLFLAENVSYTVTIEKYDAKAFGYVDHFGGGQAPVRADEEWLVAVTLKQVLN